ncbi:MAG: hypothetical protein HQL24_07255 [Candidatus Omnitrophica bacterium]|nr:hypothetical protein [Candidatus Omnitrophota bacterium]
MFSIEDIKRVLPQTFPFLLIDRIIDFKKGESLTAVKNITANEWVFGDGGHPCDVFPETLLIEAAAQTGLALYALSKNSCAPIKLTIGKIDGFFKEQAKVGDQLKITAFATKMMTNLGYIKIEITLSDLEIANIDLMYSARR